MRLSFTETEEVVKWQTAFWALVPLAIGAMLQPCGRVLDLPTKYSFWLRCSPILCIADSVQWIGLLFRFRNEHTVMLPQSTVEVRESDDNSELDLRQTKAENGTIMRWTLLCLSGIPCQTIKLVAMKGIPWTKTWALMYFLSIVVGEIQYL
ncbi:hypothetical protein B0T10DRAFT_414161, partial [Thelonectria olida]